MQLTLASQPAAEQPSSVSTTVRAVWAAAPGAVARWPDGFARPAGAEGTAEVVVEVVAEPGEGRRCPVTATLSVPGGASTVLARSSGVWATDEELGVTHFESDLLTLTIREDGEDPGTPALLYARTPALRMLGVAGGRAEIPQLSIQRVFARGEARLLA